MAEQRTPGRLTRAAALATNVLLVVVTVAGLAYLVPSLLGYDRYVITGGSMAGTYDRGSLVFERQVPVDQLAVGDVITYVPPAGSGVPGLTTHRIIEVAPAPDGSRVFRTQGDANEDPDPWTFSLTAPTQPVAQFGVPHVGWVLIALADRTVRILVIGVPAGLIALASLVQLFRALSPRTPAPEPA